MTNLEDVTFCIPAKLDSPERKQNLEFIIDFLRHHFKTNIILGELDDCRKLSHLFKKCQYYFFNYGVDFFYRTRLLNDLYKLCKTEIIVNYDTDVLFFPEQYINAANMIRNKRYDVVYPYNKIFINIADSCHFISLRKKYDINYLTKARQWIRCKNSHGGAVFFKKKSLFKSGMENERFKSWGSEDCERLERFKKLELKIGYVEGKLYHLPHPTGKDSSYQNPYFQGNEDEYKKVKAMTKEELIEYIKTWKWII